MTSSAATATPPSRRERKAASTRRAIVRSARELFEQHGYAETTVDQIADHADVAPRTFFRYFATKEALLFADFDEERQVMLETLESRPPDEDPIDSIAHVLDHFARVLVERRAELAWGFRVCGEQDAQELYERSMLKRQTNVRLAEFVAQRLGVDPAIDPRPTAWAMSVMGVFGAVLKIATTEPDEGVAAPEPAEVRAMLRSSLRDAARTMQHLADAMEPLPPA